MTASPPEGQDPDSQVAQWWATAVSRIEPGIIELREHPVQELIGHTTFVETIWLLLRGELPAPTRPASSKRPSWRGSTTVRRHPPSRPPAWRRPVGSASTARSRPG